METLQAFIQSNPRAQDLKRALAVQMIEKGHRYRHIADVLQVSIGFITSSKQRYQSKGVAGLQSNYWGTQGYLSKDQKQAILAWMAQKDHWTLEEIVEHLELEYDVVYRSKQSYYALIEEAGFSWKKSQPSHPGKDEEKVAQKNTKSWTYWRITGPISPVAS